MLYDVINIIISFVSMYLFPDTKTWAKDPQNPHSSFW